VLSGSYDQGIRVYDFDNGSEMGSYSNWTTSWILAAKSDYRRIVATSQDGRVLLMDFGWDVKGVNLLRGIPSCTCPKCGKPDCDMYHTPCSITPLQTFERILNSPASLERIETDTPVSLERIDGIDSS
jgi:hypothetical protein